MTRLRSTDETPRSGAVLLRLLLTRRRATLREEVEEDQQANAHDVREEVPGAPNGEAAAHVHDLECNAGVLHRHPGKEHARDVVEERERAGSTVEVRKENGVRVRLAVFRVVEVRPQATAKIYINEIVTRQFTSDVCTTAVDVLTLSNFDVDASQQEEQVVTRGQTLEQKRYVSRRSFDLMMQNPTATYMPQSTNEERGHGRQQARLARLGQSHTLVNVCRKKV